ncbi:MAG: MFS transporter [Mollicutes bacterium]|nr:MFS transporter [Mollicutes bacterium]
MSSKTAKKSFFNNPLLSSKIKSRSVKLFPEVALGYLVGPMFALISNGIVNTYLFQYYDKVLGLKSSALLFETLLPIISSIVIIIGNLLIGKLINRKPTAAGKARPLILLGLPILAIALLLLFIVPMSYDAAGNPQAPSIWSLLMIAIGYNLYYALAYPFYFTPHSALVNLSTRDGSARSLLATASNGAVLAAAGLSGMVGPILVDLIGLLPREAGGGKDAVTAMEANSKWTILMIIMIVLLVIGCLFEYYFTRERITEESFAIQVNEDVKTAKEEKKTSMLEQVKICVHDKYWWLIILFFFFYQFGGQLKNSDASWYAQAFSNNGSDISLAGYISIAGSIPTALGMVVIWPLANRFGKSNCIKVGAIFAFLMGVAGFVVLLPNISSNVGLVSTVSIVTFCLKALGTVPAMYISMALMSDVLDHQEALYGKRTDGFTMAVYGSIIVGLTGIANGIIVGLNGINGFSYRDSVANNRVLNTALFSGAEGVCYLIIFFMFLFMNVEKFSKLDQKTILVNRKNAILAEGGVWIDPEEKNKQEEKASMKASEEARIAELKEKCAKKGLDFSAEESKYQAMKAKKDAEKEAKANAKKMALEKKEAEKKAKFEALSDEEKAALQAKEEKKTEIQKQKETKIQLEFERQLEKAKALHI